MSRPRFGGGLMDMVLEPEAAPAPAPGPLETVYGGGTALGVPAPPPYSFGQGLAEAMHAPERAYGSLSEEQRERVERALLFNPSMPAGRVASAIGLMPEGGSGGPVDLSKATQRAMRAEDAAQPMASVEPPMDQPAAPAEAIAQVPATAPVRPVGAGTMPGPGPGTKLAGAYGDAQDASVRALEEQRELTTDLGIDKALKAQGVADLQAAEAERQAEEAREQKAINAAAVERTEALFAKQEAMIADLAKSKVDPGGFMARQDASFKIPFIIAAALSGFTNPGGKNQALDQLEKMIDNDIKAQESTLDAKKSAVSAQGNALSQMIQITGDRRVAAQQLRVMMLESSKLKIQADADRLGIPEMRTNAALATNEVQQRIDATKKGMAKDALEMFQRQAAAQAAAVRAANVARQAAEDKAWQRQMDVLKLGIERDKVDADRGGGAKEINAQIKDLSEKQGTLSDARVAVGGLRKSLDSVKPGEGIPGIGAGGDFRSRIPAKGSLASYLPGVPLLNAVAGLSDNERINRANWERLEAGFINKLTGAGVGVEERARLEKAFAGAKTPAEQRNAVFLAEEALKKAEQINFAGHDPRAVEEFQRRMGVTPEMPGTVRKK